MLDLLQKRLSISLITLTLLSIVSTYLAIQKEWVFLGVTVFFWILIFLLILKLYKRNAQKVAFMFDAIDNGDQAFNFAEQGISYPDEMVNNSLNRINKILFQAKAEVIQKEKYYELIINSVNTGIIVIDENGYVFQTNREAMKLLGMSVFTHVKQLSRIDPSLEEVISKIHPGAKEQISFSNERGTMNLLIQVSGIELQSVNMRIIAINDINKELDEKEIDSWMRLTRVLTHEIMNSITPITSLSETLLSTQGEACPEIRDGLQVINSTGKSLMSFVESYRKFTHLPTPTPTLFYVAPFAERMRQLALHQKNYSNIKIEIEIPQEDLIVYADENLVSQVVLNLLKNGLEAIGTKQEDGLIIIKAYTNKEEAVIIEIMNNGPAIPTDVMEHIFVPFFSTKEKGNGIGLSVSRQIMRLSGGSIVVKSDIQSGITCFTLTFP
ncbi:ATP-binding protein [Massilibacteroides sp.]|uniref:sensor histidine kinase n=1 Tax=Massilibacteroides sp. TaxID=2034766 RepID=UPI002629F6EA|nr:ATP-binding protein [Massilibacteroides sp.]MDD4514270.1 ATP-binding protein [Massilibacteroides sp.]